MKRNKISIIGAGNIGSNIAYLSLLRQIGDTVLVDINGDFAKGKALDILTCSAIQEFPYTVKGTEDYREISDSDAIIVTAGVPRNPSIKTRDELLAINAKITKSVAENIKKYAPNAFVVCVTNPLDAMVGYMQRISNLPPQKVVGMAGILDTARFKLFLSQALNVPVSAVNAFVMGSHGNLMFPVISLSSVNGVPLPVLLKNGDLSHSTLDKVIEQTRNGGTQIVQLLKKGSAAFSPALFAMTMAESYLYDRKLTIPSAAFAKGHYGINDELYIGVVISISAQGAKVIDVPLSADEMVLFNQSIKHLKTLNDSLQHMDI